jgi:hypothetical protein
MWKLYYNLENMVIILHNLLAFMSIYYGYNLYKSGSSLGPTKQLSN